MSRISSSRIPLILPMLIGASLWAQSPKPREAPACGTAKVRLPSPDYLTTMHGIVVVQAPKGWMLDKTRKGPFFFIRIGEDYATARTLIYINVQILPASLERAVENDVEAIAKTCDDLHVKNLKPVDLLEESCERITQQFSCQKKSGSYVDLVTKIAIRGLLLNVVLSADSAEQIAKYQGDYHYFLKNLTLVK